MHYNVFTVVIMSIGCGIQKKLDMLLNEYPAREINNHDLQILKKHKGAHFTKCQTSGSSLNCTEPQHIYCESKNKALQYCP